MEVQEAKAAVETLLLKLAIESGDLKADDGTEVEVVLWESPHPAAGVRVAEVSFRKTGVGGMCGSSWMQVELEGLRACAAVERCILARSVLAEEGDVADADHNLKELFTTESTTDVAAEEDAQGKYVRMGGTQCPFCSSTEITGNEVNIDAGTASQEISCSVCDKEWVDLYDLVGFKDEG